MRRCSSCRKVKPLPEFYKATAKANRGYQYNCKRCCRGLAHGWRQRNPRRERSIQLKKNYGITIQQFEAAERRQKRRCAICKKRAKLTVDHCHTRLVVRGLLCAKCNAGIGLLCDSITILQSAIVYLSPDVLRD